MGKKNKTKFMLKKISMILVTIGALNWGLIGVTNLNIVDQISNNIGQKFNLNKIIYIIVGIAGIYFATFAFKRDNMLPFLGITVFPCNSLQIRIPDNANKSVSIKVKPNSNVVFWAAEPKNTDEIVDYKAAYGNYNNYGVARSDNEGNVVLNVRNPQAYTIPFKGVLKPHIHYRVCKKTGMMSRIKTIYLED